MQYSILKDDKPVNTVKKIKKIIKDLNINLDEKLFVDESQLAPVSLRLEIKNKSGGTNGKGTCVENALASAYAEFAERLQNLCLFGDFSTNSAFIPDKVPFKKFDRENDFLKKYFKKKILILKKLSENGKIPEEILLLPFYSLKEKKICNLPYNIIARSKGSNGMAAGNTFAEAIVQGLSEVCERYALMQIFKKKLLLPDIPKENYLKYENIENMISYFENNGFKIHIKDASINGKIPVICTIIEDIKNNIFCPSFGAHPSIPIAIERSLTEFTQGLMLSRLRKNNFIGYQFYTKQKLKYTNMDDICISLFLYKVAFEKVKKLENIFFSKEASYKYTKNAWLSDKKSYTNKEILYILVNKILELTNDIYIRDVSFLGFPAVDIFVPNLSELIEFNEKNVERRIIDKYWEIYQSNSDRTGYNLKNLLKLSEIYSFMETLSSKAIFQVPYEYVALLCSLVLKDTKKILKYVDIVLAQNKIQKNYSEAQILTFEIIKQYYKYKKINIDDKIILKNLNKKYTKSDIKDTLEIINKITYEDVLDVVLRKEKLRNCKHKTLLKTLGRKYKKNIPNQKIFNSIFDEWKENS